MFDVTVLLGDPRLDYGYNLSNRFEQQDHDAVHTMRDALETLEGYRFHLLDDHDDLWRTLVDGSPSLILNFCNTGYRNNPARQHHIPALLEMLALPYAGAGPESIVLCHHKFLVYALAEDLGIPVPRQVLARTDDAAACERASYPAFIKPKAGDGSSGVDSGSMVNDVAQAERRLADLDAIEPGQEVLIQEYLPGPEYTVGVIGNRTTGYTVLPPLEIDFSALDDDLPRIMTYGSKVDTDSPYWRKMGFMPARSEDACRKMAMRAGSLFERIGCRDYARMDFRTDAEGEVRLIDLNAHPMWGDGGMLATMAGYHGQRYPQFLESIITAARSRLNL